MLSRLTRTVAARLTVWFLLLSILPIGVIGVFVRQTVTTEFEDLASTDLIYQARLLAGTAALAGPGGMPVLVETSTEPGRVAFIVAPGETALPDEVTDPNGTLLATILVGIEGSFRQEETGDLVAFTAIADSDAKAVVVANASVVSSPLSRIERSAFVQLAVSLILVRRRRVPIRLA